MSLFHAGNIAMRAPVRVHVTYDGCKVVGIREVYVSKRGTPEEHVTGFNAGGNSFGLDGASEVSWVRAEPWKGA